MNEFLIFYILVLKTVVQLQLHYYNTNFPHSAGQSLGFYLTEGQISLFPVGSCQLSVLSAIMLQTFHFNFFKFIASVGLFSALEEALDRRRTDY
jgi:hypothetical protein